MAVGPGRPAAGQPAAEAAGEAAIATYGGRRGHPVLLGASIWGEVGELAHDDVAAKAWLRADPGRVLEVDCTGLGDPRDIDRRRTSPPIGPAARR